MVQLGNKRLMAVFFYFALSLLLVAEGFGLKSVWLIFSFVVLSTMGILSVLGNVTAVYLPKRVTIIAIIFLIYGFFVVFFAVDIQLSFESLLRGIYVFVLLAVCYQYRVVLKQYFSVFLWTGSCILIFWSFIINHFSLFKTQLWWLMPQSGTNLVFPNFNQHNHLGDWLVLPILYILTSINNKKNKGRFILFLIILIYLLIGAQSRSAYLALSCGTFFILMLNIYKRLWLKILFVGLIIISFILILSVQRDFFLSNRTQYFSDAIWAVQHSPFFGLGFDNYQYASIKQTINEPFTSTNTSHNLFLDLFSEMGIPGGAIVLVALIATFLKGKKDQHWIMALALLVNFQTDYTFKNLTLWLIFILLMMFFYKEKSMVRINTKYLLLLMKVISICYIIIIGSHIAMENKQYYLAWRLYPFNRAIYQPLINESRQRGNFQTAQNLLKQYQRLFQADTAVQEYVGDQYADYEMQMQALKAYQQAYYWNPYQGQVAEKTYSLIQETKGDGAAHHFINRYLQTIERIKISNFSTTRVWDDARALCKQVYKHCPYNL